MENDDKLWCVEYSIKQNCFHVQQLSDSLKDNQRDLENYFKFDKYLPDYMIIAIEDTQEKASNICKYYQNLRNQKG